ncbi:MAG: HAD-IA family hydrolase [Clostridia bacterium]|nr:HAD-IA family hydrolase [Clostridia bacterium]
MNCSCVLFDLDQTLLLRTPTIPQKLHEVMTDMNVPHTMDQVDKAFADCEYWIGEQTTLENQTGVRMSDEEFLAKLTAFYQNALGIPQEGVPALQKVICRQYTRTYALMPDTKKLLAALETKGLKLGIVSNNYATIRQTLDELGLTSYFDCIVISEEVGLQKPDPAIIRLACEQCGVEPEDTIYVGDHPFDITCAHDAGAKAAWMPPNKWYRLPEGSREPEMRLAGLWELMEKGGF